MIKINKNKYYWNLANLVIGSNAIKESNNIYLIKLNNLHLYIIIYL